MIVYDFYINRIDEDDTLIVEKRIRSNKGDVTLDQYLDRLDVSDDDIGEAIEKLESLPFGLRDVQVTGRHGLVNIRQVTN